MSPLDHNLRAAAGPGHGGCLSGGGVGGGGGEWAVVLVTLSPLNCNLRAAAGPCHGGEDRDDESCLSGGGGGRGGDGDCVLTSSCHLKMTVVR